jgi:hypothetical protein
MPTNNSLKPWEITRPNRPAKYALPTTGHNPADPVRTSGTNGLQLAQEERRGPAAGLGSIALAWPSSAVEMEEGPPAGQLPTTT